MILSFCEFPVSSSLSCLDAAVSLMSPSVDACIQGNESLVLLYSFIKLSVFGSSADGNCTTREGFFFSFVVCIVNKMFSFGRRLG